MEKKLIRISRELRKQMFEKFGMSPRTLKDALEYKNNTALARALRDYAMEHGGEIWVPAQNQEGGDA